MAELTNNSKFATHVNDALRTGFRLITLMGMSPSALAHSFGNVYTPPIPFWMYAWGACGALLTSFLVFGFFFKHNSSDKADPKRVITLPRWTGHLAWLGKLLSVGLLALCIATGLFGEPSPYGNFNMSFFWIVFALGGLYLAAIVGDFYAIMNPWRALCDAVTWLWPGSTKPWIRYPQKLAYWPALIFYSAFIWIELFAHNTPHSLAVLLLSYTLINLVGSLMFGRDAWFQYAEFFAIVFRLIGGLAVLQWQRSATQAPTLQLQPPFQSSHIPVKSFSLLLVILFMLSSTAYDGLKESVFWHRLFWVDLYHAGLKTYAGTNPLAAVPQMRAWAQWWNSAWLLLSPWLYLLVYGVFIVLSQRLARSQRSCCQLALDFAGSLLPIALVYHITHYYTLIQVQGVKIIQLASDPFGWGWNLFGTADWLQRTIVPDPNTVWHVQVVLIVIGHIVSVFVAHQVALRVFENHRQAMLSQIPMLVLMLAFTTAGLWVLSLPSLA